MRERNHTSGVVSRKRLAFLWNFIPAPFLGTIIAYCLLIYYLSTMPYFPAPLPFYPSDKVAHFCIFGGLSAIVALGLQRAEHEYSAKMLLVVPVGFSVIYGLSVEIRQMFVPYRYFAVGDVAADAFGAAAAAALLWFVHRKRKSGR